MKFSGITIGVLFLLICGAARAQTARVAPVEAPAEGRPNVKAYLDYLKQELTVTDERSSQREVSRAYIRHNFNRVSALRSFALKMARESDNDYIPEMEAVTQREFHILFPENAPLAADLKTGEVYNFSYRFLGSVRNVETFYIFARLDPYEEERVRRDNDEMNAERKRATENSEKRAREKPEKTSARTQSDAEETAKPSEKNAARDLFVTAEDKKKEIFLKKNPQN